MRIKMITDETAHKLHDKATRGGELSAEEQHCLKEWYSCQDSEENTALAGSLLSEQIALLQAKVDAAVGQLKAETDRIQTLSAASEAIRQENAALRRQLAQDPKRNQHDNSSGALGKGAANRPTMPASIAE